MPDWPILGLELFDSARRPDTQEMPPAKTSIALDDRDTKLALWSGINEEESLRQSASQG
jgi:hypothetical protein